MGSHDDGMRSWPSEDGETLFIDKGNGERVIVRDTDGDGYADHVYETVEAAEEPEEE